MSGAKVAAVARVQLGLHAGFSSTSTSRIFTSVRCWSRESLRERERSSRHLAQQLRTESRTGWRELQHFHAAVLGDGLAPHKTSRLQAIDQPGDVRGVTGQRVGEPAHRQRPPGLDEVQHVALDRGEVESAAR